MKIIISINVLTNDSGPEGQTLSIDSFTQPTKGILIKNADGTLTYTPNKDYYGTDSFTYIAVDSLGAKSSSAKVLLTINGTNDKPVISTITPISTIEDSAIINGTITATDVDSTTLTYSTTAVIDGFTLNQNGTYSFNPAHSAYQSLKVGEIKTITISVSASDGSLSDSKDLVIKIIGTNDAPIAVLDTLQKIEQGEFRVNTYTQNAQGAPSITSLIDGGYLISWSSYGQDGSSSGIYAQRYDKNGAKVGVETQINTYTQNNQDSSSISSLIDGGYIITWKSDGQDGSGYGIYAQRYDKNGVKVGNETLINTYCG